MLKSRTKPAWGNGLSPFQGSGCFNVHYQGVALGWIIAAFRPPHKRMAFVRQNWQIASGKPGRS
jgi:hypothetical protein